MLGVGRSREPRGWKETKYCRKKGRVGKERTRVKSSVFLWYDRTEGRVGGRRTRVEN